MNLIKLKELHNRFSTLKEEQFYFGQIIKERDKSGCATICCFLGWLPVIYPEIGVKYGTSISYWDNDLEFGNATAFSKVYDFLEVNENERAIVDYFFEPVEDLTLVKDDSIVYFDKQGSNIQLKESLNNQKKVIELLEQGYEVD